MERRANHNSVLNFKQPMKMDNIMTWNLHPIKIHKKYFFDITDCKSTSENGQYYNNNIS